LSDTAEPSGLPDVAHRDILPAVGLAEAVLVRDAVQVSLPVEDRPIRRAGRSPSAGEVNPTVPRPKPYAVAAVEMVPAESIVRAFSACQPSAGLTVTVSGSPPLPSTVSGAPDQG
jgi:hypothetical protein